MTEHDDLPRELVLADDTEEARMAVALRMHVAGHTWQEVAAHCNFESAGQARVNVLMHRRRLMAGLEAETREEIARTTEDQINEVISSYWWQMKAGDVKAGQLVLAALDRKIRLFNLGGEEKTTTRTIVVPVREGEYAQALKEIAQSEEAS